MGAGLQVKKGDEENLAEFHIKTLDIEIADNNQQYIDGFKNLEVIHSSRIENCEKTESTLNDNSKSLSEPSSSQG